MSRIQEIQKLVNIEKLSFNAACNLIVMATESLRVCKELGYDRNHFNSIHDCVDDYYYKVDEMNPFVDKALFDMEFTPEDLTYMVHLVCTEKFNRM